jgi:hypothetical protein
VANATEDWRRDREIERQHADGGQCEDCNPWGGCIVHLGAVRRRTAPPPVGSRVSEILLAMSQPDRP